MKQLPEHLFVSVGLYDTREPDWAGNPIRADYCQSHSRIETVSALKATLRAGSYAWPGGYPMYFVTSDGAALLFETVREELHNIIDSIRRGVDDGWRVVATDINWEDGDLVDDHTGERIESAYAE